MAREPHLVFTVSGFSKEIKQTPDQTALITTSQTRSEIISHRSERAQTWTKAPRLQFSHFANGNYSRILPFFCRLMGHLYFCEHETAKEHRKHRRHVGWLELVSL